MKILLLSDTHSYIDEAILNHVKWADEVWHAGDIGDITVTDTIQSLKPLRAVYGNIDGTTMRAEFPLDAIFEVDGVKVYMTHIGGYPGKYVGRVKDKLKENPPKIFISGHSHILKVQYDTQFSLLHMNPGAAGKHGFHQVRTMLRFEIVKGEIINLAVIELGNR